MDVQLALVLSNKEAISGLYSVPLISMSTLVPMSHFLMQL